MMIKKLKKLINLFIVISILLFIVKSPVLASNNDINLNEINTNSPSCILMETSSGKILYAKNAYSKMYPASTTKLMTAILTLENCKTTDIATVSHNAIFSIPVGYSHANLKEGENLTIEQLLNVLLIPSANDAAVVLAEHISGSVQDFSVLMNQKAKEIGCVNTNFVNPNGIHNKNHYSCAYDLALIGKYAMRFSDIMRIARVTQYTLPVTNKYKKTDRIFNLTNALVNNESGNKFYYKYATGLKTGYTDSAGSCIVATAKKDNLSLIAVILNADSTSKRYADCKTLFDYGFNNYSYTNLNSSGDVIKTVEISNATNDSKQLDIVVKNDIPVLLNKNINIDDLSPNIEIDSNLKAPIAKNTVVGNISYTIDGETYSSELVANSYINASGFETIIFRILLIFLILYIIYRLLNHGSKNKPLKSDRKNKKNKNNYRTHSGSGKFKYKQINDYL